MSTAALFTRLVDNAAMFPPEDLPADEAVHAHRRHREAPYADLVGPFVCTDENLPIVAKLAGDTPLRVSVVVTGGAGAIEPAVGYGRRSRAVDVAAVEVRLRDENGLSRNAQRVAAMCADCIDDEEVFVEVGFDGGWERALDVVAEAGYAAKLRTGGLTADMFPTSEQVASFVTACLDREVPFKCTAGLHNAVRHSSAEGFEQHGFLNVLLATRASLDGAGPAEVAGVLEDRSAADVSARARELDAGVRRWFRSFGSCSIDEPVRELTTLGLMPA
jgi:hypothetical protein